MSSFVFLLHLIQIDSFYSVYFLIDYVLNEMNLIENLIFVKQTPIRRIEKK